MDDQFKTDASNATLNPLYIQKNPTIESPPTPPPATTKLSYYWHIFRAILFLIIPIIILWIIPYYNVSVYIWSYYVLITQATILCTIIDEKNNIHKRLVIFMILFLYYIEKMIFFNKNIIN